MEDGETSLETLMADINALRPDEQARAFRIIALYTQYDQSPDQQRFAIEHAHSCLGATGLAALRESDVEAYERAINPPPSFPTTPPPQQTSAYEELLVDCDGWRPAADVIAGIQSGKVRDDADAALAWETAEMLYTRQYTVPQPHESIG